MTLKKNQLERINTTLTIVKSDELPEGQFDAILSTEDLDNHGEKVSIGGLQIPKNKTIRMYWNHDKYGKLLPIGKWIRVWKQDGKLYGRGQIDMEDEFAVKVYKKILAEVIDSISIGFKPLEYDTREDMWTKSILTEASVVSEPANESAVITNKKLGFTQEEFDEQAKKKAELEKSRKPEKDDIEAGDVDADIVAAIEELKSRVGAVEDAQNASTENPAMVQKIRVRMAAKEVDKAANKLNRIVKVKLMESK